MGIEATKRVRRGSVVGVFDGVHRGHVYLLHTLRSLCAERALEPVALTFAQHPLQLIDPKRVPPLLAERSRSFELIAAEGVTPVVLDFDAQLRALTARQFMAHIRDRYGVTLLMLGFNNRIGSDGPHSPEQYRLIGEREGVEVVIAPPYPDEAVSSSMIRKLIIEGSVEQAGRLLGRRPELCGTVVSGRRLGRTIGFPTANLDVSREPMAVPSAGVYAARALNRVAVVNIGSRPTVEGHHKTIEVHIDDFSGNLYGSTLQVELLRKLRNEQRFPSLDALRAAIQADLIAARRNQP